MTLKKKLEHDGTYFFLSNLKAQCTRPIDLRPNQLTSVLKEVEQFMKYLPKERLIKRIIHNLFFRNLK